MTFAVPGCGAFGTDAFGQLEDAIDTVGADSVDREMLFQSV